MRDEIWRDIKGFEEYRVSDWGNVIRHTTGYMPHNNPKGYETVKLWNYDRYYYKQVHKLVAETFLENPNNLPYVRHKNGNHHDNRAINLEFYG
jgi:hypothetical protein